MDITMTPGPAGLEWADAAACALPTAQRPLRLAEFDDLFRVSLRSIDRASHTRARLLLAGGDDLARRAQRLADAESSCCSFFAFGVTAPEPGMVAFDVEVPPAYAGVLDGLVARAEAIAGGAA